MKCAYNHKEYTNTELVSLEKVKKNYKLEVESDQLKSEFKLLNQNAKTIEKKIKEASPKGIKCNACYLIFQTGTWLKVDIDLEQGRFHRIYTDVSFCNFLNKIYHRESSLVVLDWFILLKSYN